MRLFLKEHILLLVLQVIQLISVISIFWLDGYRDMRMLGYAVFLSFFFLGCYLFLYYITHRKFYRRLTKQLESIDDSFQKTDQAPVSIAFDSVLREQYKLYQNKSMVQEKQQDEHKKFMDQWVHQMKTPLSVIELTAQNLDEPESSSIREETDRMKMGLNTVLNMARLRTIEQDFHIKQVVLSKVVHEVNGENKRYFIRNKVYPTFMEEREEITVETDEKWLFFILTQLINNAVKYSEGKSNHIAISIYENEKEAILEVQDFGVGIPDTDKKRLFDPFFTGENGRKFRESTGMGLYLVKETLAYLGHRLEMESEVGKGSTFRIIFTETQNLTTM